MFAMKEKYYQMNDKGDEALVSFTVPFVNVSFISERWAFSVLVKLFGIEICRIYIPLDYHPNIEALELKDEQKE